MEGSTLEQEHNALHDFFIATNGQNWTWQPNLVYWNFSSGIDDNSTCSWHGITCACVDGGNCTIKSLELQSFNLVGTLTSSLGILTTLQILDVRDNFLTNTIPTSIGQIQSLQNLFLLHNSLTGSLPSAIGNLKNLVSIGLDVNLLTGSLPSALASLSCLQYLSVSQNSFSGSIPFEIINLERLLVFDAQYNSITGKIPSNLDSWESLNLLLLNDNSITGSLPSAIGTLVALAQIDLYDNLMSGHIPTSIVGLLNLAYVDACCNQFSGSLPSQVGQLTKLQLLSLFSNSLTGALPCLGAAASLTHVYLSKNMLTGELSTDMQCWPATLNTLAINDNQFGGSLPASLFKANISELVVSNNAFSGTLPSQLASSGTIKALLLRNNNFEGRPDEAFNASAQVMLSAVDLSANRFTGPVPSTLFRSSALKAFAAVESCYSGPLPDAICACTSLEILLMDGLSAGPRCRSPIALIPGIATYTAKAVPGGIPSCIWMLPNLRALHLSSNQLTGSLSPVIASTQLVNVILSHNYLTGEVPVALLALNLTKLDLSNNRLMRINSVASPPASDSFADAVFSAVDNRFSGWVPSSYVDAPPGHVSLMEGNLFDCDLQHPHPPYAPQEKKTLCASTSIDIALGWWVVVILFLFAVGLVLRYCRGEEVAERYSADGVSSLRVNAGERLARGLWQFMTRQVGDGLFVNPIHRFGARRSHRLQGRARDKPSTPSLLSPSPPLSISSGSASASASASLKTRLLLTRDHRTNESPLATFPPRGEDSFGSSLPGSGRASSIAKLWVVKSASFPTEVLDSELWRFTTFFKDTVRMKLLLLVVVLACCVVYVALKYVGGCSTHTYQRLWVTTSAFMSGWVCAVVVLAMWGICLVIVARGVLDYGTGDGKDYVEKMQSLERSRHPAARFRPKRGSGGSSECENEGSFTDGDDESTMKGASTIAKAFAFVGSAGVFVSLIAANIGYLWVYLYSDVDLDIQIVAQVVMGVIKFLVNSLVIPLHTSYLYQTFGEASMSTCALVRFVLYASNNVIFPFFVTMATDSSCFVDLFASDEEITETFSYALTPDVTCFDVNFTSSAPPPTGRYCYTFSPYKTYVNSYFPPFTYSYQCGSAVVRNYAPVMLYCYALQILVTPCVTLLAVKYFLVRDDAELTDKCNHSTASRSMRSAVQRAVDALVACCGRLVPGVWRPLSTDKRGLFLFSSSTTVVSSMQMLLVMLTFGLSCPLLGLVVFVAALVELATTLTVLEIYLQVSPRCGFVMSRLPQMWGGRPMATSTHSSAFGISASELAEGRLVGPPGLETTVPQPRPQASVDSLAASSPEWGPTLGGLGRLGGPGKPSIDLTGGLNEASTGARAAAVSLCWLVMQASAVYWALMAFDMVGDAPHTTLLDAIWPPVVIVLVPLPIWICLRRCKCKWSENDRLRAETSGETSGETKVAEGTNAQSGLPSFVSTFGCDAQRSSASTTSSSRWDGFMWSFLGRLKSGRRSHPSLSASSNGSTSRSSGERKADECELSSMDSRERKSAK